MITTKRDLIINELISLSSSFSSLIYWLKLKMCDWLLVSDICKWLFRLKFYTPFVSSQVLYSVDSLFCNKCPCFIYVRLLFQSILTTLRSIKYTTSHNQLKSLYRVLEKVKAIIILHSKNSMEQTFIPFL